MERSLLVPAMPDGIGARGAWVTTGAVAMSDGI